MALRQDNGGSREAAVPASQTLASSAGAPLPAAGGRIPHRDEPATCISSAPPSVGRTRKAQIDRPSGIIVCICLLSPASLCNLAQCIAPIGPSPRCGDDLKSAVMLLMRTDQEFPFARRASFSATRALTSFVTSVAGIGLLAGKRMEALLSW